MIWYVTRICKNTLEIFAYKYLIRHTQYYWTYFWSKHVLDFFYFPQSSIISSQAHFLHPLCGYFQIKLRYNTEFKILYTKTVNRERHPSDKTASTEKYYGKGEVLLIWHISLTRSDGFRNIQNIWMKLLKNWPICLPATAVTPAAPATSFIFLFTMMWKQNFKL